MRDVKNPREGYCRMSVHSPGAYLSRQCSRRAVEDGYCRQHGPTAKAKAEAKRDALSDWLRQTTYERDEARAEASCLRAAIEQHRSRHRGVAGNSADRLLWEALGNG